jgi:hypothetical protein
VTESAHHAIHPADATREKAMIEPPRIAAAGHEPGQDLWECYVAGPESSPDPASWRTELSRPLARTAQAHD